MATLQIKRGKKVNLPVLKEGEFGYCSDTKELFIGTVSGNVLVTSNMDPENLTSAVPVKKGGTGGTTAAEALVNLGALSKTGDASDSTAKYTVASSNTALTSGETLSVALGKVAKAVSSLISHLGDKVNPHAVTKSQIGLGNVDDKSSATIRGEITSSNVTAALGFTPLNAALKGTANGLAELDANGLVRAAQLPSYVDDVLEGYLNNGVFYKESTYSTVIASESGKIYTDLATNKVYRWSGSTYVVISDTVTLGETSATAYRGDHGKTAYDHSLLTSGNPHGVTKANVGLGSVDNTADSAKNVASAAKWTTTRTITLGTAVTATAQNINGEANVTIPITAINATYITSGTIPSSDRLPTVPITKGGTGATTVAAALANLGIAGVAAVGMRVFGTSNSSMAIGSTAGTNATGNDSVMVGAGTAPNSSGNGTTTVGAYAGYRLTNSYGNTLIGRGAGQDITSGASNTCVGEGAGTWVTTGEYNVHIGAQARPSQNETKTIRIGTYDGQQTDCYISGIYGKTAASGASVIINSSHKLGTTTSSKRYKRNIETMEQKYADLFFDNARPVYYKSNTELCVGDNPDYGWWGFIAEELAEIDPRLVYFDYHEDDYEMVTRTRLATRPIQNPAYEEHYENVYKESDTEFDEDGNPILFLIGQELVDNGEPRYIEEDYLEEYPEKVLKEGAVKSPRTVLYERITAPLTKEVQRHRKEIKELRAIVETLLSKAS